MCVCSTCRWARQRLKWVVAGITHWHWRRRRAATPGARAHTARQHRRRVNIVVKYAILLILNMFWLWFVCALWCIASCYCVSWTWRSIGQSTRIQFKSLSFLFLNLFSYISLLTMKLSLCSCRWERCWSIDWWHCVWCTYLTNVDHRWSFVGVWFSWRWRFGTKSSEFTFILLFMSLFYIIIVNIINLY